MTYTSLDFTKESMWEEYSNSIKKAMEIDKELSTMRGSSQNPVLPFIHAIAQIMLADSSQESQCIKYAIIQLRFFADTWPWSKVQSFISSSGESVYLFTDLLGREEARITIKPFGARTLQKVSGYATPSSRSGLYTYKTISVDPFKTKILECTF